jgi:PKD repeat protein
MTMDLHIVREPVIGVFILMALTTGLTILATAISAQGHATALASTPSPILPGSAIDSGAYGASTRPIGAIKPGQAPPNPSLLAVPLVGTAPLTVAFDVGLANTPDSLVYEWNFGDGGESFLPAEPYMLHVYQNPGTYVCELRVVTPQGSSTTASTKITVKARQG